jgi:enoyl-CoA hydratase
MSDDDPAVVTTISDGIASIAVDDGKVNAMSHAVIDAINAGLDQAEADASAVVISGRPGKFCAGFDLSVMADGADGPRELLRSGAQLWVRMFVFPKPIVVACTGHALAAGAITLLAADTRIGASGNYKIGMNEVAIGMPLPRCAMELARDRLSKRHFTAAANHAHIYDPQSAVEAGFLDQIVPDEDVLAAAHEHAAGLAGSVNALAFATTRELARRGTADAILAGLDEDVAAFFVAT